MIDVVEPLARVLLQPMTPGLVLVVAGCTVVVKQPAWKRGGWSAVGAGVLALWLPATYLVATALAAPLERAYPPSEPEALPAADAVVVLGGAIGAAVPPRVGPDLHDGSDRVWFAAQLYRADRAPVVIVSGGSENGPSESRAMQTMLTAWGVPDSAIVEEGESLSTHANARNTARILEARGWEEVLLVTSAMHMPRAVATFRHAGVRVHPAATDVRVTSLTPRAPWPDAGALQLTTAALHEYAATVAYDWAGRL